LGSSQQDTQLEATIFYLYGRWWKGKIKKGGIIHKKALIYWSSQGIQAGEGEEQSNQAQVALENDKSWWSTHLEGWVSAYFENDQIEQRHKRKINHGNEPKNQEGLIAQS